MPLSREQLQAAIQEHIRAENAKDYDALRLTIHEDVQYLLKAPSCPDDPNPFGLFIGADVYIQMWEGLYEIFESYDIDIEQLQIDETRGTVWMSLTSTVVPKLDWHGLPKGKRVSWGAVCLCEFGDDGRMTKEVVYGSFPPMMKGYQRIKDFHGAQA